MKINWEKVREQFEEEMNLKLQGLPGHRQVLENLKEFRNIISHELPETAPIQIFKQLINILLEEKPVNLLEIKEKYLNPQLEAEAQFLNKFMKELKQLKKSAGKWVKVNLPEEDLTLSWKEHRTWLPRRYLVYKGKKVSFQRIAADTLARYALIRELNLLK